MKSSAAFIFLRKVKILRIFPYYMLFLSPLLPLDVLRYASRGKNDDSASECGSPCYLFTIDKNRIII